MKKALIIANLGGFVDFLHSDIDILREMGYEITYAANLEAVSWEHGRKILEEKKIKFKNICFDSKKPFSKDNLKAYKQIKELLKENFDLIHCHTPITGLLTKLAARKYRKYGTKVIYTTHGFTFTKSSSKKSWFIYYNMEKFLSKLSDAIITINKEDYENAKTMKCKNVYYINGVGVDIKKYSCAQIDRTEYRKKLGIDKNEIMILSIGELSNRKNHEIIVEALSKMKNKNRYIFVICGVGINGGTGQFLEHEAKRLNVRLKLLGYRDDIPEIIRCSDIGAIPSIREGLGLAGIQSLAGGVPLAASDVQGIKDYVINGKTGYSCDAFNSNEFALAIEKLSNKEDRLRMVEYCKEKAKEFDMSVSEKQRKKIYKELLE